MDEPQVTPRSGVWSLVAAMALGALALAPLLVIALAWWPATIAVAVIVVVAVLIFRHLASRDKGIAATRIGVRGKRFAEFVRPTGLACPRCAYDLAGAEGDRCPECGEELELIVRTQVHYEFVQNAAGPGISERDMRGLAADTARVLGLAILLPAIIAPAGIIATKASGGRSPAIFSMAALAYMGYAAWRWWRRRFAEDLPRQRTEAVLALGLTGCLAVVCSLIDLAY
jgi:hypothetical protein